MTPSASAHTKHPFRNILRFVAGDAFSKALAFVAMVWLARALGVGAFGTLEFALALLTWLLVLADGGIEIWATREAAQGVDLRALAGRVVPLRLILSILTGLLLLCLIPLLPDYESLPQILLIFAGCLPIQALNLKWAFLGREQMTPVGIGLVLGQLVFAAGVIAFVREPADLMAVPLLRLVSDIVTGLWFGNRFIRRNGTFRLTLPSRSDAPMLRPAFAYGAAHALALASFNFDSLLLGFLGTAEDVGLYGAAYKPVVAGLAIPMAYFMGLYPTLARTWSDGSTAFRELATKSLRLAASLALPLGVLGVVFAEDVLILLFSDAYAGAAQALQILSVSAVLVVLRGTYRRGLLAAGAVRLDLRCAAAATGLNVVLNFVLIPLYGIEGAAVATLASEVAWLGMTTLFFKRAVVSLPLLPNLIRPLLATATLVGWLLLSSSVPWVLRAVLGVAVYSIALAGIQRVAARRSA